MPPNPQQLIQAFSQLMQDPAAMQAMMQGAQQMGIPPEMLQQLAGGAGGGGGMMQGPGGGPQPMPPDMGGAGPSGEGEMPPEGDMPPEQTPEEMVEGEIDGAGATFDGVDAPTKNDIQRLMEDPSETMVAAFDAQFGQGAADKYLGGGESEPSEEPDATGPEPQESAEY